MENIVVEINDNSEVVINNIVIDDAIFEEERSDYILIERLEHIDNLIGWSIEKADSFLRGEDEGFKIVNIKFLKQGLLKTKIPADLKGDFLADYCKEILDNTSDQELVNAMVDVAESDGSYPYGMFDADCFQVEMVEDAETFEQLFQTKTWEYFGEEDAIGDIEDENKAMGDFLEKQLGFSRDSVCDIAHGSIKLYIVHVVHENELQSYKCYTKIEDAHAAYVSLCKKWYKLDALSSFCEGKNGTAVECYDSYYGSPEYHDACDNAHVTWEVLNG